MPVGETKVLGVSAFIVQVTWLICLLLEAGDIHPNPGPSTSSISSISSSLNNSFSAILSSFHHLSYLQYNVQICWAIRVWLHHDIPDEDLKLATYHSPERKDRKNDPHGGVFIYIKDTCSIHYKRRLDLELPGIECIWVEITMKNKRFLGFSIDRLVLTQYIMVLLKIQYILL